MFPIPPPPPYPHFFPTFSPSPPSLSPFLPHVLTISLFPHPPPPYPHFFPTFSRLHITPSTPSSPHLIFFPILLPHSLSSPPPTLPPIPTYSPSLSPFLSHVLPLPLFPHPPPPYPHFFPTFSRLTLPPLHHLLPISISFPSSYPIPSLPHLLPYPLFPHPPPPYPHFFSTFSRLTLPPLHHLLPISISFPFSSPIPSTPPPYLISAPRSPHPLLPPPCSHFFPTFSRLHITTSTPPSPHLNFFPILLPLSQLGLQIVGSLLFNGHICTVYEMK